MPASVRRVTAEDLVPDAEYERERQSRGAVLLPLKQLRRISLGPYCTLMFETYDTILSQIQEMLLADRGAAARIEDHLAAYNSLIPQGRELVAAVMFEIDEPGRRAGVLGSLGGVEDYFFVQVDVERISAAPEADMERIRDGETPSGRFLRFLRFRFPDEDSAAAFGDYERPVMIGCDHPHYRHITVLSEEVRAELARDLD
jgi:hypothetical protein